MTNIQEIFEKSKNKALRGGIAGSNFYGCSGVFSNVVKNYDELSICKWR